MDRKRHTKEVKVLDAFGVELALADVEVECWFCGKTSKSSKTVVLPNGARVCRRHTCMICAQLVRPKQAIVLRTPAINGGSVRIEYLCARHRRYIVDRVKNNHAIIHAGDSKW